MNIMTPEFETLITAPREATPILEVEPSNNNNFKPAFELEEMVDLKSLRIIRDNFEIVFNEKLGGQLKVYNQYTGEYEITTDYKTAFTQVNNLYKSKVISLLVQYGYSKKLTYGRRYHLVPSLQECPRPIRHTISKNIYYDIDIKNAHPLFCYQYCRNIGFKHRQLKEYVCGDREGFLKSLIGTQIGKKLIENRDDAKAYFLKILNGGGSPNINNEFLKSFYIRHQEFLKLFYNNKNNIKYKSRAINSYEKREKEGNIKFDNKMGSSLNYYLAEIENIILEKIEQYLQMNNIKYGTLCFDGLMVYKDSIKDLDLFILELNNFLKIAMGYNIPIMEKPMDEDIDLSGLNIVENYEEECKLLSYNNIKKDFEFSKERLPRIFKCLFPITYCEIREDETIEMSSKTDFTERYRTLTYTLYDKKKGEVKNKFIPKWLDDPDLLTYSHFDFLPCQEVPKNVFNTFKGFQAEKLTLEKTISDFNSSLIMTHIKNLCGNNDKMITYFLNFLACRVQNPKRRTNTCMIFKSAEGTGKDMFFNWFSNKIIGEKYCTSTANLEGIFGKFNSLASNKILTILNEVSGSRTRELIEQIKCNITAETINIEYKGMNQFKETNNNAFIILTNNENCIQIKPSERRFIVSEVNNEIANKETYFTPLVEEFQSGSYDRTFYDYLLSLDISTYNFTTERPITESYEDMQSMNIPISALFIKDYIQKSKYNKEDEKIKKADLFNKYLSYIEKNKYKIESTPVKFGIELKKYGLSLSTDKRYYIINHDIIINNLISKKYMKADDINFIDDNQNEEDSDDEDNNNKINPLDV